MGKGKQSRLSPRIPRNSRPQGPKTDLGVRVPGTLREALGTRDKNGIGVFDSYTKANPYYNPFYDAYSSNCQRCVVAFELRRRGYDVVALPTWDTDVKPRVAKEMNDGRIYARWMGAFQGAKPVFVGNDSSVRAGTKAAERQVIGNLGKQLSEPGTRGVVQVFWRNGGGHVFNAEHTNTGIRYFDAQTSKPVDISDYIGDARTQSVNFIRTDNLNVSGRAREFVTRPY